MNNFIKYFYGIKVDKIMYDKKNYYFMYDNYLYRLLVYEENDVELLIDTNRKLLGNTLVSEIIFNRNNEIVSVYKNIGYLLIKVYANSNKYISLEEINYLANSLYKEKLKINYGLLWSRKIDYLEELITENGKKYPLMVDSFNYFVGLAENAISYYNDILIDENYKYVISHKKIKFDDTVDVLYNPLNIVFDYRVRDIAEYIKNAFFLNKNNIFTELDHYFMNNTLSLMEVKILIARILYPSFYFDLYENILVDDEEEKILIDIISNLDNYEEYLASVISYFRQFYDIDEISWLKKEDY